jgi:DNA invertase Pin-like site-specific DNA recombinase
MLEATTCPVAVVIGMTPIVRKRRQRCPRKRRNRTGDTTSPAGRMVLTIFAGIAKLARSSIHERTNSGRAAAKARERGFFGPPPCRLSRSPLPGS